MRKFLFFTTMLVLGIGLGSNDAALAERGVNPFTATATNYADRNSPQAIANLAQRLASMVTPTDADLHMFDTDMQAKHPAEALRDFKAELLGRLRYINPNSKVLVQWTASPLLPGPWDADPARRAAIMKQADALLHGTIIDQDEQIDIGPPGTVNWQGPKGGVTDRRSFPWHVAAFDPLISAYVFTGERKYLDIWSSYADDWAINQTEGMATLKPELVGDVQSAGSNRMLAMVRALHYIAATPGGAEALPSATLARVLLRMIGNELPTTFAYYQACPQNWTLGAAPQFAAVGLYLKEFRFSGEFRRLARRMLETWNTTQNLPDGSENQRDLGYNSMYVEQSALFRSLFEEHGGNPKWMTPDWRHGLDTNMLQRSRFLLHNLTQNGEQPAAVRADKRNRAIMLFPMVSQHTPFVLHEPTIQRLINVYFPAKSVSTPSTWQMSKKPQPDYRSEWFPYGGYYLLRNGWKQSDALLTMVSSSTRGKEFVISTDNNIVTLRDFGQDLLATTKVSAYDYNNAPIQVDGKNEYFTAGIPSWGHRGYLTSVRHQLPPPWHWLSSTHFDVAEGKYSGPFGDRPKEINPIDGNLDQEITWVKSSVRASQDAIRDVRTQRWVESLQDEGLYIITDRVDSPRPHRYSQLWPLPIGPSNYPVFKDSCIVIDQQAQTVKTQCAGVANLSIYHFGQPVTFSKSVRHTTGHYRLYDLSVVQGDWSNHGEQSLLVTVLAPRRTAADNNIASIQVSSAGPNVSGFSAHLKDGTRVEYLAASGSAELLKIGNITAKASSLLVEIPETGVTRGVALNCQGLSIDGQPQQVEAGYFEFAVQDEKLQVVHRIYRPIVPVKILPANTTGFIGSESISMSSPTPDVEIHYTLDGTSPTTASPLYTKPFTISMSTVVTARAMRPGVAHIPETQDGTLVSNTTQVKFTKLVLSPAKPVAGLLRPGLRYTFYLGSWQDVALFPYLLKPTASGAVPALFDLRARHGDGPYAFQYTGYLDVPADGVYTFYAPPELVATTIMPGYVLRFEIDGHRWYPSTQRHAFGSWAIALQKGPHPVTIYWGDYRTPGLANKLNDPGLKAKYIWDGTRPSLLVSGPASTTPVSIPPSWWKRDKPLISPGKIDSSMQKLQSSHNLPFLGE